VPLYQRRSIDCCNAWRAVSDDWGVAGSGLGCGFGLSLMVLTFVEVGASSGTGRARLDRDRRTFRTREEPSTKKDSCRTSLRFLTAVLVCAASAEHPRRELAD
jgi:hypothetical protein